MHVDSFASSVQRVTGFEITLAGIVLHGSTDTAILREACARPGFPPSARSAHRGILEAMRNAVAERRHEMDLVRMPGVEEVLDHLARQGALLGVATGNLELIGWIKIETGRPARVVPLRRLQRSLSHPLRNWWARRQTRRGNSPAAAHRSA